MLAGSWAKTGKPRELSTPCLVFQKDILILRIGSKKNTDSASGSTTTHFFRRQAIAWEKTRRPAAFSGRTVNGPLSEKTRKIRGHSHTRWKTVTVREPTSLPEAWEAKSGMPD